jgi:hypothetical protein
MTFKSFDERLNNWGRTVRTSPHRDAACNWWAEVFVKLRDARLGNGSPAISRDELDGWLLEEAWKHLPNHVSKWILRYHFVFNMGQQQIQSTLWQKHKVRLRGYQFEISLDNARVALAREITAISGKHVVENFARKTCKPENPFL